VRPEIVHRYLLPACQELFPERAALMSVPAQAMLLAIGLQESQFMHRQQLVGGVREWWRSLTGPAAGYWQFERIGVRGVLEHRTTGPMMHRACVALGYPVDVETLWSAARYDNILAVVLARLALFRLPQPLPTRAQPNEGWRQYIDAWRPGKPHEARWQDNWDQAWRIVEQ